MSLTKTQVEANAPTKSAAAVADAKQPAVADKQRSLVGTAGLQRAAAGSLPPPGSSSNAAQARLIRAMQGSVGNSRVGRLVGNAAQAKLTVGAPNDPYEREADRTADAVMRTPQAERITEEPAKIPAKPADYLATSPAPAGAPSSEAPVMTQTESGELQASPNLQQKLQQSKGGGRPLAKDARSFFETRLGADLGNVSIHTGADAVEMNKQLGAQAFTHGSDIYFDEGKYDPGSSSGKHLLAHELTHTVQQGASAVRTKRQDGKSDSALSPHGAPKIQAAWYNFTIPGTDYQFDPSIEGIKNAANIAKDAVVEGSKSAAQKVKDAVASGVEWIVDEIKGLVSSGIDWLRGQWDSLKELATAKFDALKNSFSGMLKFIQDPLGAIADALVNFDAAALAGAWKTFNGIVTGVWKGFKALAEGLLDQVNGLWEKISGYATSLLNKVSSLTQNFLFTKLPDALQKIAYSLIDQLKSLWKNINDGWKTVFGKIKTWVDGALDTVLKFVQRVSSFAINVVIDGIRRFGHMILLIKDIIANPKKYIDVLIAKAVATFTGLENRFEQAIAKYIGGEAKTGPGAAMGGRIQRQPAPTATAGAKSSASWSAIGSGIWKVMKNKWGEFWNNKLAVLGRLLLDLFFPIYGDIVDIIDLVKNIKKIVTGPLGAGSLEEFWTSFLKILDIPLLIYNTIISIVTRTSALALIIAAFDPEPVTRAIAAGIGEALLAAFVQGELLNIGHKLLLLKTGATTGDEKNDAYNSIGDSIIGMIMAGIIFLIVLILSYLVNVARGIYSFLKGKIFPVEKAPVEIKGGGGGEGEGEGKGGTGDKEEPKNKPDETDPEKVKAKRTELIKRAKELNKRADDLAKKYGKSDDPDLQRITESTDDVLTKTHNGEQLDKLGDFEKTLDENSKALDQLEAGYHQEIVDNATSQKLRAHRATEAAPDHAGGKHQAQLAKIATDAEFIEGELKKGAVDAKTMEDFRSTLDKNKSELEDIERDLGAEVTPPWKGPVDYSSVPNPPADAVGPGRDFTPAHKERLRAHNRAKNDGLLRSDLDGTVLDDPAQGSDNPLQAEIDHKEPKSKGGSNTSENAQILSKAQNGAKSDK